MIGKATLTVMLLLPRSLKTLRYEQWNTVSDIADFTDYHNETCTEPKPVMIAVRMNTVVHVASRSRYQRFRSNSPCLDFSVPSHRFRSTLAPQFCITSGEITSTFLPG